MATTTASPGEHLGRHSGEARFRARERMVRIVLGVVAAVLVLLAFKAPIWQASLSAPQYPDGLKLSAYGDRVVGDIAEINELNHYVGMETFSTKDTPELELWMPVIAMTLAGIVVGSLGGRQWWGRLARLGVWFVPIGALADVQFRLYQYGHQVQPDAAIRLDPFTPLVVGPTKVLNFTTWAYPGPAIWALFVAASLITFGPGIVRRFLDRDRSPADADATEAT